MYLDDRLPPRFWAKVEVDASGCWRWLAGTNGKRYGMIRWKVDGVWKHLLAHRVAYQELVGTIPPHLEIDHLCRERGCVNPEHLEAVTHKVNLQRSNIREASARELAERTHCKRGHPYPTEGPKRCRTCIRAAERRYREKQNAESSDHHRARGAGAEGLRGQEWQDRQLQRGDGLGLG